MLHLNKAYNQLSISKNDRHKVAFSALGKHYKPTRVVYGLCSAPAAFVRVINKIFKDIDDVWSFIDDCIIITNTWDEH